MVAAYVALGRTATSDRRAQTVRQVVLGVAGVEVAALVAMMALLVLGLPGLGYPQAVMVAVASIWFALVGLGLDNRRPDRATVPDAPGDPAGEMERSRG
jgi:hypothetical protein